MLTTKIFNEPEELKHYIEKLVENEILEDLHLDFKLRFDINDNTHKQEFAKDIVSFANAFGGYLIIGVEEGKGEKKGVAVSIPGVKLDRAFDELVRGLNDYQQAKIEPVINGIRYKLVNLDNETNVIIIHVPTSYQKPHRVKDGKVKGFYMRTASSNNPMDYETLRRQLLSTHILSQQIKEFRRERIHAIMNQIDIPIDIDLNPAFIVHLIPINAFSLSIDYNLTLIKEKIPYGLPGLNRPHLDTTFNIDGLYGISQNRKCYTQLFRNGILELCDQTIKIERPNSEVKYFNLAAVSLWRQFPILFNILNILDISVHIIAMFSLINAKGYMIAELGSSNIIDRSVIYVPNIEIDDITSLCYQVNAPPAQVQEISKKCAIILKPLFDRLWQAAGFSHCLAYDRERII